MSCELAQATCRTPRRPADVVRLLQPRLARDQWQIQNWSPTGRSRPRSFPADTSGPSRRRFPGDRQDSSRETPRTKSIRRPLARVRSRDSATSDRATDRVAISRMRCLPPHRANAQGSMRPPVCNREHELRQPDSPPDFPSRWNPAKPAVGCPCARHRSLGRFSALWNARETCGRVGYGVGRPAHSICFNFCHVRLQGDLSPNWPAE